MTAGNGPDHARVVNDTDERSSPLGPACQFLHPTLPLLFFFEARPRQSGRSAPAGNARLNAVPNAQQLHRSWANDRYVPLSRSLYFMVGFKTLVPLEAVQRAGLQRSTRPPWMEKNPFRNAPDPMDWIALMILFLSL